MPVVVRAPVSLISVVIRPAVRRLGRVVRLLRRVVALVLIALARYIEGPLANVWKDTLLVCYHVVELREVILEHAEAVAAGPQAPTGPGNV